MGFKVYVDVIASQYIPDTSNKADLYLTNILKIPVKQVNAKLFEFRSTFKYKPSYLRIYVDKNTTYSVDSNKISFTVYSLASAEVQNSTVKLKNNACTIGCTNNNTQNFDKQAFKSKSMKIEVSSRTPYIAALVLAFVPRGINDLEANFENKYPVAWNLLILYHAILTVSTLLYSQYLKINNKTIKTGSDILRTGYQRMDIDNTVFFIYPLICVQMI